MCGYDREKIRHAPPPKQLRVDGVRKFCRMFKRRITVKDKRLRKLRDRLFHQKRKPLPCTVYSEKVLHSPTATITRTWNHQPYPKEIGANDDEEERRKKSATNGLITTALGSSGSVTNAFDGLLSLGSKVGGCGSFLDVFSDQFDVLCAISQDTLTSAFLAPTNFSKQTQKYDGKQFA